MQRWKNKLILKFGILSIWNGENLMINKLPSFVFAQPINWDHFNMKMTQNFKILKTTQVVRDHKGNILLINHKK